MATKERPIKKGKLSEVVVERLNAKIRSGELKAGEKLPTERAMAESMGVSRTVIREAIRIMVDKNVLELKNGCGYVRQLSFDEIMENMSEMFDLDEVSIFEIMEVRMVLENYIVKKAVKNITGEQIEELQKEIDKMAQIMNERDDAVEQESAFHRGLAEATGNSALKSVYVLCEDLLRRAQRDSWRVAKAIGAPNTAVADHQAILDAIQEKSENRAELLMQAHMDYAYQNLKHLYGKEEKK